MLRTGRSQLFGLIVSDINNPFFPELIDNFESLARSRNIDVIFTHTNYNVHRLGDCITRLIERNVDGIAICTSETNHEALIGIARRNIPFVLLNQDGSQTPFKNIYVDHKAGAVQAIDHLYRLGHRRIAFIAGPREFDSTRARQRAFIAAMGKFGLEVRDDWVIQGNLHPTSGKAAMDQLMSEKSRPTAVFCTNDLMAFGALRAAHERDLSVPEDVSLVGFDNLPVCEMVSPSLTSVDIPRHEIASHAFHLLVGGTDRDQGKVRIKTSLVVRRSSGKAPARHR